MSLVDSPAPAVATRGRGSTTGTCAMAGAIAGFAVSLLPSLLPRLPIVQGLVSGVLVAVGYGFGTVLARAARRQDAGRIVARVALAAAGLVAAFCAWHWLGWQNAQRHAMGMAPLSRSAWLAVLAGAAGTALVLLASARGLARVVRRFDHRAEGALVLAAVIIAVPALLVAGLMSATSAWAHQRDSGTTAGAAQPDSGLRSGSPASLVSWQSLGRKGRDFVAFGPTAAELAAANGPGGLEPIRVYIGRESADTVSGRARLAAAELRRTGAFDRGILVLAVPTGTGLVEPLAADALEYLRNGDTAIAAIAYSDLPSWLSVVMDRGKVRDTARALFDEVYAIWQSLPADRRPQLYLYGHSLGAYGVQPVIDEAAQLPVPIDGALLAGPPFMGALTQPRMIGVRYLQHPSDPVVLVSSSLLWQRPSWLGSDRPPDLPAQMRWLPGVTWLQVAADLPQAVFVPWGHGHMYSETDYLRGWADDQVGQQRIEQLVDLMRNDSSPVSFMFN